MVDIINKVHQTNEAVLKHFYDTIEPIVTENNQSRDHDMIWNCDETGVPLDFRPRKVVASKHAQNIWSLNSGDKTNITVWVVQVQLGK